MRSATSSANITVSARRLPYSRVTSDPAASSAAAIDSTGVMPEPAAISTCRPRTARSGVNAPDGGWTSIVSPGRVPRTSQPDTHPSGTSRTPIRGARPGGTQIE